MKKKILYFIVTLLVLTLGIALIGCGGGSTEPTPETDYNEDVQVVLPEDITAEHFVTEEGKQYYTSPGLSLWMEVNGAFLEMDYFSLDGTKRVYDNMHFYVGDYFYMLTDDCKDLYASLLNGETEYAEQETQDGEDVQINVKKSGIYKLIFDVETLEFDLQFKSEIQTPVYYTIKNCSIYTTKTSWVEMSKNPDNENEFVIKDFNLQAGDTMSFFSNIHISWYKVTLDECVADKYVSGQGKSVTVNVGGKYNIYINKTTYVVRVELQNADTASYSCVYYDGTDFITLQPYETDVPYVFHQAIEVSTKYTTEVPDFHTENYRTYNLTIVECDLIMLSYGDYCFKQPGKYNLIINLKTFELKVELLPE